MARETDCLFRRLYASKRAPWRGPKWIGRLWSGLRSYTSWKRESIRGSEVPEAHRVLVCLSERRRDRERYGSRAKANQQLSKRSWSRSGRTLLYARDVVVANVPGPRCVQAVVGRQAPRQEERAMLRTQCVFAFLFRSHALHSSRIAKRCRSNLTLGSRGSFDNKEWRMSLPRRSLSREISASDERFCWLLCPFLQNLGSLGFECYKTISNFYDRAWKQSYTSIGANRSEVNNYSSSYFSCNNVIDWWSVSVVVEVFRWEGCFRLEANGRRVVILGGFRGRAAVVATAESHGNLNCGLGAV